MSDDDDDFDDRDENDGVWYCHGNARCVTSCLISVVVVRDEGTDGNDDDSNDNDYVDCFSI